MRYNTILIITDIVDIRPILTDIWNQHKNWCIISTDDCLNYEVISYINKNHQTIIVNDGQCFKSQPTNKFLKYCEKNNILPIFISDAKNLAGFVHLMYSNIEESITDSFEYIHANLESDVYKDFLNLIGGFLW